MNNEELNTALYEKMRREQNQYREWLLRQPPEEILNHSYEYIMREDILMAMEDMNLPNDKAQALFRQRGPLADVFKDYERVETDHMETMRSVIESCAERKSALEQNLEAR